jgi:Xaa-Pro aminopeptidase
MYDWPAIDETGLQRTRDERARALMGPLRLDHLLLTSFDNIRYLTGYRTLIIAEAFDWFAAIVGQQGDFEMFVPWVDEVAKEPDPDLPGLLAVHPLPSWTPAIPHVSYWVQALRGVLAERRARRVGYEMLYAELLGPLIEALPEVEFVPVTTALHDLRMRKDELELTLLESASKVNSIAADAALKSAETGMTDYDVLSVAMASLQAAGVEFLSHSLCNLRRGSGTWFAVGNELREGDSFFFDIGCYGPGGYASDMARTGFVGQPPAKVLNVYRQLLAAHRVGEGFARPGVRASSVHETINARLREQGLPLTPYSLGHGVGLRACELPTIYRADRMGRDQVLQEGMVISLEPETGVEVDGRLIILKVEDNYVVEEGGLRRLTDAPYTVFDV